MSDLVVSHYGGDQDLAHGILSRLDNAGVDTEQLTLEDLFPVDQLHAGGAGATGHVLEAAGCSAGVRLLDVGCGVGGTTRMAADRGAVVTGIDLSPTFVTAAQELTQRVGLADRATFLVTSGDDLPFEDGAFDAAVMIHVGMNIPDKAAVFTEVRRVLTPGARFAVYEQVRASEGPLPYPLPWAVDEQSSFVETAEQYSEHLRSAGFAVATPKDLTAPGGPPPGGLDQTAVFGDAFRERLANNVRPTQDGLLRALLLVATA